MYTACGAAGDGAELTLISNVVSVLVTATSLQPSKLQRLAGGGTPEAIPVQKNVHAHVHVLHVLLFA